MAQTTEQSGWAETAVTKSTAVAVMDAVERVRTEAKTTTRDNRRTHQRLPAAALDWIQGARIKYGPEVMIVDISQSGILVESDRPLKPGSKQALEIVSSGRTLVVPVAVLRSKIAALGPKGPVYRTACTFNRLLDLPELAAEAQRGEPALAGAERGVDRLPTPER